MGKCKTKVLKVEFDVSDDQVTKVRVESDFWGDCPIGMKRVHEKTFPVRHPMTELMTMDGGVKDYIEW